MIVTKRCIMIMNDMPNPNEMMKKMMGCKKKPDMMKKCMGRIKELVELNKQMLVELKKLNKSK